MLNPADADFRRRIAETLGDDVLREPEARYLEEPRRRVAGQAGFVVAPRSTEEVSATLRLCNTARVPVVPYGGGSGLVGGQIMPGEGPTPVVLSLERMTRLRRIDPAENTIEVEAGMTLADVQTAAASENRLFPLSLASEGSARIGGNLATNAGGVNVLRYGNARALCLGVEAVLADGRVLNSLSRLRKDNTGYDLKDLLIGSEGTLGVLTAASLRLHARPAVIGTAMMVVRDPAAALELLNMARDTVGEGVSAFELVHGVGLDFVAETIPDLRRPFQPHPEWMVLIELGLPEGQQAEDRLSALFEAGFRAGLVSDGVIAQSDSQRQELWTLREQIPEANKRIGAVVSHDVSLPLSSIAAFIDEGFRRIAEIGPFRVNSFGHLGDGNLHYNVFPPKGKRREDFADQKARIQRAVHDLVAEMGGSFSAEHGIGRFKVGELERYGDPVKLAVMRDLKSVLDPNGILNPGAVLA